MDVDSCQASELLILSESSGFSFALEESNLVTFFDWALDVTDQESLFVRKVALDLGDGTSRSYIVRSSDIPVLLSTSSTLAMYICSFPSCSI